SSSFAPLLYLTLRPPPCLTPFPYTTLFRSSSPSPPPTGRAAAPPSSTSWTSATAASACSPARRTPSPPASACRATTPRSVRPVRSEEHTSELQSRFDLVCRLLLEKKKKSTQ